MIYTTGRAKVKNAAGKYYLSTVSSHGKTRMLHVAWKTATGAEYYAKQVAERLERWVSKKIIN